MLNPTKKFSPLFLIQAQAEAELEMRRRRGDRELVPPSDWREWLTALFPRYVTAPFGARHIEFWEWIDAIQIDKEPRPLTAFWGRGGAKSTSAELGCTRVGATNKRKYIWYVSSTQDKADGHVDSIASLLEDPNVEKYYPELAQRKLGKFGNSKGWRRSRLRTASGFTVDALGLDTGARGVKVEDQRPDMIVLDDVDELHDSFATTAKKIETITKSVLPSGANGNCAILFIQNLIHSDSIASQLADGRADYLTNRIISGPHPAIIGLTYEQRGGRFMITGGTATWEGQNLEICQSQMDKWGLSAFLQEAQHEVDRVGGIWDHVAFQYIDYDKCPVFVRTTVWVDPAVTSTDQSDSMGIQADGLGVDNKIYRLFSWEGITSPEDALERAILKGVEIGAEHVGVETDQGGDTWKSVYERACEKIRRTRSKIRLPEFASDKAGAGHGSKVERNARMLVDYEHGSVVHVRGTHTALEKSLLRFPNKPLDLCDASYWSWDDLRNKTTGGGFSASYR